MLLFFRAYNRRPSKWPPTAADKRRSPPPPLSRVDRAPPASAGHGPVSATESPFRSCAAHRAADQVSPPDGPPLFPFFPPCTEKKPPMPPFQFSLAWANRSPWAAHWREPPPPASSSSVSGAGKSSISLDFAKPPPPLMPFGELHLPRLLVHFSTASHPHNSLDLFMVTTDLHRALAAAETTTYTSPQLPSTFPPPPPRPASAPSHVDAPGLDLVTCTRLVNPCHPYHHAGYGHGDREPRAHRAPMSWAGTRTLGQAEPCSLGPVCSWILFMHFQFRKSVIRLNTSRTSYKHPNSVEMHRKFIKNVN
jgi:hypothetical protein